MKVRSLAARFASERAAHQRAVEVVAECLHEPVDRAHVVVERMRCNQRRWFKQTTALLSRLARGRPHGLDVSDRERARLVAFAEYLERERRPKVLLGLHFGNFLVGLLKMLDLAPTGTRVFAPVPARSLVTLAPVAQYAVAMGKELNLLPLKSTAMLALRRARESRDVVLLLGDLGSSYGTTVQTTLFDKPVRLVSGPHALARALRAPVVLVHAEPSRKDEELRLHAANDECTLSAEPSAARASAKGELPSVATLAAQYAAWIERLIQSHPSHWTRWPRIHELFVSPGDVAAPTCRRR
jgi:lauroyl/myristoyl acyltransferase